jgi:hypothetical protein
MHKEPNGTLVMTTCKCRENTTNLVISRAYFTEMLENKIAFGAKLEQERIIDLLQGLTHTKTDGWDSDSDVWLKDKWISILKLIKAGADD